MGKGDVSNGGSSLVEEDIKKMAKGWNMPVTEAKKNMLEMLQKQLGTK